MVELLHHVEIISAVMVFALIVWHARSFVLHVDKTSVDLRFRRK